MASLHQCMSNLRYAPGSLAPIGKFPVVYFTWIAVSVPPH
jgi:hypothetical protein